MTALTVPADIDTSLARRPSLSALLDAAKRHLDEARTYEQVKKVRAEARALEAFAKAVGAGREAQRLCAEYVLRADQRLGQELRKIEKAKGGGGRHGRKRSRDATASPASPKLSDLGITKSQSSRVQALAAVPAKVLEEYIATAPEISIGGALKLTEVKKARRAAKEKELAAKTKAAASKLGAKLYGVIYADPPWRFEPYSRDTGMDRAADNHYPTLPESEIAALKIPTARDCVLFLWATAPMLLEALNVLDSWGFAYKTHFVWAKNKIGTGYWCRNQHELLLIGTKGDVPAPVPGQQCASLIAAPVGKHSEKPQRFAEMIEAMFPSVPRLEMFARGARPGWDSWGNEA